MVSKLSDNKRCTYNKEELNAKDISELEKISAMCEVKVNYAGKGAGDDEVVDNADENFAPEPPKLFAKNEGK